MMKETFLVRDSKLTDNQKRFLTDQGCKIEPFISLNRWLDDQGYSITISDSRARAAWELVRDPNELTTRLYNYTEMERIAVTGSSADLTIVDEVNTIPPEIWYNLKAD